MSILFFGDPREIHQSRFASVEPSAATLVRVAFYSSNLRGSMQKGEDT